MSTVKFVHFFSNNSVGTAVPDPEEGFVFSIAGPEPDQAERDRWERWVRISYLAHHGQDPAFQEIRDIAAEMGGLLENDPNA